MLDIKFIRDNASFVKKALAEKNTIVAIDRILEIEEIRKKTQFDFETLRARQNKISKDIGHLIKQKQDSTELIASMQGVGEEIKKLSTNLTCLSLELESLLLTVPNIPHYTVPVGKNADHNIVIKTCGQFKRYSYQIQEHQEIAMKRGLVDFARGAKITGHGFPVYTGAGAILERALVSFMLDYHVDKHGYTEILVPHIVNRQSMIGTGQLPKLENDMYHIKEEDFFLIPTSEVPVTNLYAQEIISEKQLPIKNVCYSPCFRKEAGSYGKDTKGLQRVHQFNKVEMVRIVHPAESWDILEEMLADAEDILIALELPYRVLSLCTGDMSFASAKTYDLEVWSPATEKFLEVSSVTNFLDFQARRANIRYRDAERKVHYVHTLNGSGLATPRTFIAILENYQQEDGTIIIPKVLVPYMRGIETI